MQKNLLFPVPEKYNDALRFLYIRGSPAPVPLICFPSNSPHIEKKHRGFLCGAARKYSDNFMTNLHANTELFQKSFGVLLA